MVLGPVITEEKHRHDDPSFPSVLDQRESTRRHAAT